MSSVSVIPTKLNFRYFNDPLGGVVHMTQRVISASKILQGYALEDDTDRFEFLCLRDAWVRPSDTKAEGTVTCLGCLAVMQP